jgi:hypothetical protein
MGGIKGEERYPMEDADHFTPTLTFPHLGGGNFGLFSKTSSLDYGGLLVLFTLRLNASPGRHHTLDFSPLMGYFL